MLFGCWRTVFDFNGFDVQKMFNSEVMYLLSSVDSHSRFADDIESYQLSELKFGCSIQFKVHSHSQINDSLATNTEIL